MVKKLAIATVLTVAALYGFSLLEFKMGEQPEDLIGSWKGMRRDVMWRVDLREDGRMTAGSEAGMTDARRDGDWGVRDGKMNWMYAATPSPLKAALSGPDEVFELIRVDASTIELVATTGERIRMRRLVPTPG